MKCSRPAKGLLRPKSPSAEQLHRRRIELALLSILGSENDWKVEFERLGHSHPELREELLQRLGFLQEAGVLPGSGPVLPQRSR